MNKKGDSPLPMIFGVFVFIVVWVFLAPWINDMGERQVSINSLTGVEAFVYMNLNFVIFISLSIMIVSSYAYFSSGDGF